MQTVDVLYDDSLPTSFKNDGYGLTLCRNINYYFHYRQYVLPTIAPNFTPGKQETFVLNAGIFDVTGVQVAFGDIWIPWVKEKFSSVFYVVSGPKMGSFRFHEAQRSLGDLVDDPWRNALYRRKVRKGTPFYDSTVIKDLAIARIVHGQIQTSKALMDRNYQF